MLKTLFRNKIAKFFSIVIVILSLFPFATFAQSIVDSMFLVNYKVKGIEPEFCQNAIGQLGLQVEVTKTFNDKKTKTTKECFFSGGPVSPELNKKF